MVDRPSFEVDFQDIRRLETREVSAVHPNILGAHRAYVNPLR